MRGSGVSETKTSRLVLGIDGGQTSTTADAASAAIGAK
jgi:hypothetical protein